MGSCSHCLVMLLPLKKASSRAFRATPAARLAPADSPPTRKPFLRSTLRSEALSATYGRLVKLSSMGYDRHDSPT